MDQFTAQYIERVVKDLGFTTTSIYKKGKPLHKFGKGLLSNAGDTLVATNEQYDPDDLVTDYSLSVTDGNPITHASSTNNSWNPTIKIEGMYQDSDGDLIFKIQTLTLTGQTPKALDQALRIVTRVEATNESLTDDICIYAYDAVELPITAGEPDEVDAIGMMIDASLADNQSQKAMTGIAANNAYAVFVVQAHWLAKQSGSATIKFQVKKTDSVWKTKGEVSCGDGYAGLLTFPTGYIVEPNSLVRLIGSSTSASGIAVAGWCRVNTS